MKIVKHSETCNIMKVSYFRNKTIMIFCISLLTALPCGPLVANVGVPNSTFVPCLNETLCEFDRPPKPLPFPLE